MAVPRSYTDEPMMDSSSNNGVELDAYGAGNFADAGRSRSGNQQYGSTTAQGYGSATAQQYASTPSQQYAPPSDQQSSSSAAARRYSPMRVTPTPNEKAQYVSYTPSSQGPPPRQSPTRPGMFQSQSYFATPSTLRPLSQTSETLAAVFG